MGSLEGKTISRTYQRIIQTDSEITDGSLKQVSSGSGNPTSMKLSTNKAEFQKVGIGTDGVTPDGLLHVLSVSAGSVTASSFANQLTLENSGDAGLSILSGTSSFGHIYFGDANDNDVGGISYDHSNDSLNFTVDGSQSMTLDKSGNLSIGGVLSQSEDRYTLTEYFHDLPYKTLGRSEVTQLTSGTTAVEKDTKFVRLTTATIDLAASDSVEFQLNNSFIEENSHVLAYIVDSSGTIADNAMVDVMVHDVSNGECKIRLSTNSVDVASQTYTLHITVDPHVVANHQWRVTGNNSEGNRVRYGSLTSGILLRTKTSDNDQVILYPKDGDDGIYDGGPHPSGSNVSIWHSNLMTPQLKETTLEIPVTTAVSVSNMAFYAGWKGSPENEDYRIDSHDCYFLYATNDDLGPLTNNGNLHFIYTVSGEEYVTDLGITVAANTTYRLKIVFDENRKPSAFVNGIQYGLTHTPTTTTAGGVTESNSTKKGLALSTVSIVPCVAVQTLEAAVKDFYVHFVRASRNLT